MTFHHVLTFHNMVIAHHMMILHPAPSPRRSSWFCLIRRRCQRWAASSHLGWRWRGSVAEVEVDFGGCLPTSSYCQRGGGFRFLDFFWPTRRRLKPSLPKWRPRKWRWSQFHLDLWNRWNRKLRRRRSRSRWRRRRRRRVVLGRKFHLAVPNILRWGTSHLWPTSHPPNLSHMVLVFLPLQLSLHLHPSSPHHGFPFFTLISLARCLPPTGWCVEAAKCGELSFLSGLPTPHSCRELHDAWCNLSL